MDTFGAGEMPCSHTVDIQQQTPVWDCWSHSPWNRDWDGSTENVYGDGLHTVFLPITWAIHGFNTLQCRNGRTVCSWLCSVISQLKQSWMQSLCFCMMHLPVHFVYKGPERVIAFFCICNFVYSYNPQYTVTKPGCTILNWSFLRLRSNTFSWVCSCGLKQTRYSIW